MTFHANAFKRAILKGERQLGLWSTLQSPAVVEVLAGAGYDWLLVDTEHSPNELPAVVAQLMALTGSKAEAVVRPAWNDLVLIKRLLDVGAQTLLVPFVQNAAEAARAASAIRYPPQGLRGVSLATRANDYGRVRDYFQRVHDELCLIVQLETRAALGALEAIAEVEGVDAVFIGPSDLAADFGQLGNSAHPEVQKAIADACARCRKLGKPVGTFAPVESDAKRFLDMGFTFVAIGSDVGLLRSGGDALLARFE